MNLKTKITTVVLGLFLTTVSFGQSATLTDQLGVGGPVLFDKIAYHLAWTAHPSGIYYKQEYLAKGDTLEKFKKLILLELLTGKSKLKDVVASKVAELKKLKASNPVVQYETFEKDGEIMLDFLISQNSPDGKLVLVVERNVYRYKSVVEQNGQKGVLLFGVSERAYGDDIDQFFSNLQTHRFDLINLVGEVNLPALAIAK